MSKVWAILKKVNGQIANKKVIRFLFEQLKDGRYQVEVFPHDKRSNPQNRYLHGILIPEFRKALNSVGYGEVKTDEQAKLILKSMFLTKEVNNDCDGVDQKVHYVQDTHTLTKEEMTILIDEVIQFAAENMNYQIAYPSEQTMIEYE